MRSNRKKIDITPSSIIDEVSTMTSTSVQLIDTTTMITTDDITSDMSTTKTISNIEPEIVTETNHILSFLNR